MENLTIGSKIETTFEGETKIITLARVTATRITWYGEGHRTLRHGKSASALWITKIQAAKNIESGFWKILS